MISTSNGKSPVSVLKGSVGLIVVYYAVIFGGWAIMANLFPIKLRTLFRVFNFFWMAVSAALLALFMEQLVRTLYNHGFYGTTTRIAA